MKYRPMYFLGENECYSPFVQYSRFTFDTKEEAIEFAQKWAREEMASKHKNVEYHDNQFGCKAFVSGLYYDDYDAHWFTFTDSFDIPEENFDGCDIFCVFYDDDDLDEEVYL